MAITKNPYGWPIFEGLPNPRYGLDFGLERGEMAASLEEAKENFARYGLLDNRVIFLKGFFNKTLPTAPITKLSVLRADSDLYRVPDGRAEQSLPQTFGRRIRDHRRLLRTGGVQACH